jgi:hypothetical protein
MTPDQETVEHQLRMQLMSVDLDLKRKQSFWETPKALAAVVATVAVVVGVVAGWFGYAVATRPTQLQLNFPPGTTITVPPK